MRFPDPSIFSRSPTPFYNAILGMAARRGVTWDLSAGGRAQKVDPKRDELFVLVASPLSLRAWRSLLGNDPDCKEGQSKGKIFTTVAANRWPRESAVLLSLGREGARLRFLSSSGVGFFRLTASGRTHVFSSDRTLSIPPGNPSGVMVRDHTSLLHHLPLT